MQGLTYLEFEYLRILRILELDFAITLYILGHVKKSCAVSTTADVHNSALELIILDIT